MTNMIIRPSKATGQHIPYAIGRFSQDDDSYVINQMGGRSPFGDFLCSLASSYAVDVLPNGFGKSWYKGSEITLPDGLGKAWYLRDRESGSVWSAFFSPSCEKADEYELSYSPGQMSVFSLKNKIASTLTIATSADGSHELWRVRLENRSAQDRVIEFTTYVQPYINSPLEAKYLARDRSLVMRVPLEQIETDQEGGELAFFHASTLIPTRYQTSKSDFLGDQRTLRNPHHLEDEMSTGADGQVRDAVMSLTVEIELPIEGEAEFGFCFGVAHGADKALKVVRSLKKTGALAAAVEQSRDCWRSLSSGLQVESSDTVFDALVNTWLPYEAYAGWLRDRNCSADLDAARLADLLRRVYPILPMASDVSRDSLLSFAASLSLIGAYDAGTGSLVDLPVEELLWLPITTAHYVAETGDREVLEMGISLKEGPSLTLKEHCERVIGMCLNSSRSSEPGIHALLALLIPQWLLIFGDLARASGEANLTSRRLAEKREYPEQRTLPRRIRYFQSISPATSDDRVSQAVQACTTSTDTGSRDAQAACCVYSALVEHMLGLTSTVEGLILKPELPESWCECDIVKRFRGDTYNIHISRSAVGNGTATSVVVDGEPVLGEMLPRYGDGKEHRVDVVIG